MRARYYDAGLGRFLSRDTWAYNYLNPMELNRYVYAANNSISYIDPTGLMADTDGLNKNTIKQKTALQKFVTDPFVQGATAGIIGYAFGNWIYNNFFNPGPNVPLNMVDLVFSGLFGGFLNVAITKVYYLTLPDTLASAFGIAMRSETIVESVKIGSLIAKLLGYSCSTMFTNVVSQIFTEIVSPTEGGLDDDIVISTASIATAITLATTPLFDYIMEKTRFSSSITRSIGILVNIAVNTLTNLAIATNKDALENVQGAT